MKKFNLIAAVAMNGAIGDLKTNELLWHLPSDLKHFKEMTTGKTIIMGSKTFDSIGKVLPNRRNVIITRTTDRAIEFAARGVHAIYHTLQDALQHEEDGAMVIGGGRIYEEAMKFGPNKLFITLVKVEAKNDVVMFPFPGRLLTQDSVSLPNGEKYVCEKRSEWMTKNELQFQFTEFASTSTA